MSLLNTPKKPILIDNFQEDMGIWQKRTFPGSDPKAKFNHLLEEVDELGDAIEEGDKHEIAMEAADCIMLIFGILFCLGISAQYAMTTKFVELKNRKWGEPDENGVVHHIKEDT